jgi:hypothetical protein
LRLLLVSVLAFVLAAGTAGAQTRGAEFNDPAGDAGNALDVTTVDVEDNGTDFGFRVLMPPGFPDASDIIEILIETDHNPATGRTSDGADYGLFFQGGNPSSYGLVKFQGDGFTQVHFDDVEVVWGTGLEFDIAAADLGIKTGFDFKVLTGVGLPLQAPNADVAPDTGYWHYDLGGPPEPIVLDRVLTTAPKKPRVGKAFRLQVAIRLVQGDASAIRSPDGLICAATVGKAKVKATAKRLSATAAACDLTVPKKTKGKTLAVKATAQYGDQTKSATYTAKIAP